ncbi:MAG TPA: outer membrane lipoprotein chaperone LolA [Blastocatellia bacterium]|jgi:outer membrane lipoprotein carrier protein|nr:outer membrane lipoprotein chaperone LolA [Blastocatellia bacterium]
MRNRSLVYLFGGAHALPRLNIHLRALAAPVVSAALFVIALSSLAPAAAPVSSLSPQTPDLGAIIDGLQRKYSRMRGLEANFVQVYQGANGQTARESGRLLLKRPGKARWEYSEPERKLFVSDGRNIFFYVAGERQATQTTVRQSADPQIPFLFLLGRGNLRRDFSRIEVAANENPAGAGNVVLRLVPRRAPEEFKQLLVEVSPSSFEVQRMVIFERNGARMDFLLSNVRENFLAPDSQFQFTPPPGVVVKKAQ